MSMPPKSVDALFQRLLTRYGAAWLRMWEHVEPEDVKADWERVLAGVPGWRILHGLNHLPAEKPPTATAFRSLCMGPLGRQQAPRLSRPMAPSDKVAELANRARAAVPAQIHPYTWAFRLLEREKRDGRLPINLRQDLDRVRHLFTEDTRA
jgi:hypothetical protein